MAFTFWELFSYIIPEFSLLLQNLVLQLFGYYIILLVIKDLSLSLGFRKQLLEEIFFVISFSVLIHATEQLLSHIESLLF